MAIGWRKSIICLSLVMVAVSWAGPDAHSTPPPTHSYAPPSQPSETLPGAFPPGPASSFNKDLDLPEAGNYLGEVLRAIHGGYFPATIAQLAVVKDGEPVQALLIETQGRSPWHVRSSRLGMVPWARFVALRKKFLDALVANAETGGPDVWRNGELLVCTDDGTGMVEYSSLYGLRASLSKCDDGPTIEIEDEIITAVRNAVT